jgi:hypothetical protein
MHGAPRATYWPRTFRLSRCLVPTHARERNQLANIGSDEIGFITVGARRSRKADVGEWSVVEASAPRPLADAQRYWLTTAMPETLAWLAIAEKGTAAGWSLASYGTQPASRASTRSLTEGAVAELRGVLHEGGDGPDATLFVAHSDFILADGMLDDNLAR